MSEQLKTISNSNAKLFDSLINEFTQNKEIVITNFNFSVSSQSKRTVYTAFIFYLDKNEYNEIKKREAALLERKDKPKTIASTRKPKPTKPRKTKPKQLVEA